MWQRERAGYLSLASALGFLHRSHSGHRQADRYLGDIRVRRGRRHFYTDTVYRIRHWGALWTSSALLCASTAAGPHHAWTNGHGLLSRGYYRCKPEVLLVANLSESQLRDGSAFDCCLRLGL